MRALRSWSVASLIFAVAVSGSGCCGRSEPRDPQIAERVAALDTTITDCTEITSPGTYYLGSDINGTVDACISIHDTSNVTLDCLQHAISSPLRVVVVSNTNTFTIRNCTITQPPSYSRNDFVLIDNSPNGLLTHDTVGLVAQRPDYGEYMQVNGSNNLVVSYDTFNVPLRVQLRTERIGCSFVCRVNQCSSMIQVTAGSSIALFGFIGNDLDYPYASPGGTDDWRQRRTGSGQSNDIRVRGTAPSDCCLAIDAVLEHNRQHNDCRFCELPGINAAGSTSLRSFTIQRTPWCSCSFGTSGGCACI
jgi:hypothetical protein